MSGMTRQPRERAIEHFVGGRVVVCWGSRRCEHCFPIVIRTPRLKPFGPVVARAAA